VIWHAFDAFWYHTRTNEVSHNALSEAK